MKLSVQNGCFSYRAGQPLLENISFEVESGDVLAILGPNGAGKTTLLKCMLNLLHWRQGQTLSPCCSSGCRVTVRAEAPCSICRIRSSMLCSAICSLGWTMVVITGTQ